MNEIRIRIRKIERFDELHQVYKLTHDTFVGAGLCERMSNRMMIHHPDQDVIPETSIYVAEKDGVIVGSLSFTFDNPYGLMVDPEFKEYIDRYREFYGRIANMWRFVIHPNHQNDSRILRLLLCTASYCMHKFRTPICFFTFSPKHAQIYSRLINTEEVCRGKDTNERIKEEHAEVVLMKLYIDKIPEKFKTLKEEELFV